jgi:hypothetical protein
METKLLTAEQRRDNQVALAELLKNRKRQGKEEIKKDINNPKVQAAIERLRNRNAF